MKILLVSISSPHFFGWTEQLKDSGHELFWFDVNGSGEHIERINFVDQITNWRYRWDFPGRYRLKNLHGISALVKMINERNMLRVFENCLKTIKPDLVHSFVMYLGAAPIYPVMQNNTQISWLYSSWGSDLFYYRNDQFEKYRMKEVLPKIDYLITDCQRDYEIAKNHGFIGEFLGVLPGGGGIDYNKYKGNIEEFPERSVISVKGYQGKHGKCIEVLRALKLCKNKLKKFKIIVFGASTEVLTFIETEQLYRSLNLEVLGVIGHPGVMQIFGSSVIYIGNSTSDGMPNTLLEAISMGAFPIQSNPGGSTEEIIENGVNGFLIENPLDSNHIAFLIETALENNSLVQKGAAYNTSKWIAKFERKEIKKKILGCYNTVAYDLKLN